MNNLYLWYAGTLTPPPPPIPPAHGPQKKTLNLNSEYTEINKLLIFLVMLRQEEMEYFTRIDNYSPTYNYYSHITYFNSAQKSGASGSVKSTARGLGVSSRSYSTPESWSEPHLSTS